MKRKYIKQKHKSISTIGEEVGFGVEYIEGREHSRMKMLRTLLVFHQNKKREQVVSQIIRKE